MNALVQFVAGCLIIIGTYPPPPIPPPEAYELADPCAYVEATGCATDRDRAVTRIQKAFPESEWTTAIRVADCESGFDPTAKNPSSSAAGIFQFIHSTWDWVAGETGLPDYEAGGPYDPWDATRAAAWLVENGGWQHWVCK